MPTPRVAAIHDLSGLGRCSLTVALPVLSVMGCQCAPMPTAVLSSQTGGVTGIADDIDFFRQDFKSYRRFPYDLTIHFNKRTDRLRNDFHRTASADKQLLHLRKGTRKQLMSLGCYHTHRYVRNHGHIELPIIQRSI